MYRVVYRVVYHKAVEALVCPSEVSSKDAAQGLHDRFRYMVVGDERLTFAVFSFLVNLQISA